MRKITKGLEPSELTAWKRKYPNSRYDDLAKEPNDTEQQKAKKVEVRQEIRKAAIKEQHGLCAYCCDKINATNSHNEHVIAQNLNRNRTLDFSNIVASCNTTRRCGDEHKSQPLPLTPLMAECETELRFRWYTGQVEGLTERATKAIEVLGLDNKAIREERKRMINDLIVPDNFDDLQGIGDELLTDLLVGFQYPDSDGQLLPYSPVLTNILKQFLGTS